MGEPQNNDLHTHKLLNWKGFQRTDIFKYGFWPLWLLGIALSQVNIYWSLWITQLNNPELNILRQSYGFWGGLMGFLEGDGGADAECVHFWCSQYRQRQHPGWKHSSLVGVQIQALCLCLLSCSHAGSGRPFPSAGIGFHAVRSGTSTGWDPKVRNSSFSCQCTGHSPRSPQLHPCGSP